MQQLEDKKRSAAELQTLRTENAQTDRVLRQAKNFPGKKEKAHKDMKETARALIEELESKNGKIVSCSWEIDKWKRKFADKNNLLKKQMLETMDLRQQHNMAVININTAKARIEDLNGQVSMAQAQIHDELTEKRKVDKANAEMEHTLAGKGMTEAEQKLALFEAEREQTNRLHHSLNFKQEDGDRLLAQLKEEETLAKEMLDQKINLEQEMELVEEDARVMA